MSEPQISVVLCARNEASRIEKSIQAIKACEPAELIVAELIVVDGGSTDNTVEIAERLGARVIRSGGKGLAPDRQIGADAATHPLVAYIDADHCSQVDQRHWYGFWNFGDVMQPYAADVVARSVCGGWQINMNNREDDKESALEWAEYIAAQHAKHPAPPEIKGKAFGISQAIGKAAQERERPALEAKAAKYSITRPETAESP